MRHVKFYLLTFLFCFSEVVVADVCESEWLTLYNQSENFTQNQLLDAWLKKESACSQSWFFEYKKARLIMATGDILKAKELALIARENHKDSSPFDLIVITINKLEAIQSNKFNQSSAIEIEKKLMAMINKKISGYPEYKLELAMAKYANGKADEAIVYAKEGLENEDRIPLLRILALAYEKKESYPNVVKTLDRMFSLDKEEMLKNTEVLLLSARAYAATERMDLAKIAIVQASEISPQDMEDPEIQRTIQFIKAKIASGEFKNQ